MEESVFQRMSSHGAEHWWFRARRQILRDQIAALRLPPRPQILEAGCGPGGNLPMLAEFGEVTGFEPNEGARQAAIELTDIEVRGGTLPDDTLFPAESFDLIVAFDVVEHIDDDAGAVRSLARMLRAGGYFLMTVPAYRWLWSEHDEHHHHRRRYTRPEVRKVVEAAGLRVEKCSHFNTLLMPAVLLRRGFARLSGSRLGPDDAMPAPAVNGLLRRIFASERHLLRRGSLPAGVSILCLARKP